MSKPNTDIAAEVERLKKANSTLRAQVKELKDHEYCWCCEALDKETDKLYKENKKLLKDMGYTYHKLMKAHDLMFEGKTNEGLSILGALRLPPQYEGKN